MKREKEIVIGVDIGGTGTKIGLVDKLGRIIARDESISTKSHESFNGYIDEVGRIINSLVISTGCKENIKGIGVGAPDSNYYTGNIEHAFNLPWKGILPLAGMLSKRCNTGVRVTNDANAAAIGEMRYGAAKGMKNFIVITLGTGVGSGIVINGEVVYGCDGFAGELGHVTMVRGEEGRLCGCGRRGCLEAYCSATGVARTAKEMIEKINEPSLLRDIKEIISRDVYEAACNGDKLALNIFDFTGRMLGEAIADFIAFSSPEAIILFGGLTRAGEYLLKPLKQAVEKNVLHTFKGKTKILLSQLKDSDAAILGASALAWEIE